MSTDALLINRTNACAATFGRVETVRYLLNLAVLSAQSQRSYRLSHLKISAKSIRQFHLSWRFALHIEQRGTRNEYSHTLRARCCYIQSVSTVQELHSAWRILWS